MPTPAVRPGPTTTYADPEALPPNLKGEIIDGTLYTQPRPVYRHSRATPRSPSI